MRRQSISTTTLILENLDEHLKCCVCLDQYTNPRALPCMHSFCHSCIKRIPYHEDKEGNESIICPLCRMQCSLKGKQRCELPRSIVHNSLMALRDDLRKKKQARERCEKHKQPFRLNCQTCQDPICFECAVFEHKSHDHLSIETAYSQHKLEMRDQIMELKKKIDIFSIKATNLSNTQSELEKKGADLTAQIKHQTKNLIDKLLSNEKQLLKEVEEAIEQKGRNLTRQRETVAKVLDELITCSDLTETSLSEWSQAKFLREKTNIIQRIQAITEEIDPEIFQPFENTDVIMHTPPPLSLRKVQYTTCTNKALVIKPATLEQQSYATLTLKSQNNQPFKLPHSTSLVRGKIINSQNHTQVPVKVVQIQTGEYKLYFTLHQRGLYTISVSVGGVELSGSPYDIPIIYNVGTVNRSIKTIDKVKSPSAIGVFDDNSIVVIDIGNRSLVLFDQQGKLLNRISPNDGEEFCPYGVTVSLDQHILLTNGNRIFKLNRNGQCVAVFGFKDPGRAFSHLHNPTGIAVHPVTGDVFVVDSKNNRVQQLKANLTQPHTIISDPSKKYFNEPSDIAFDNNGFMYIADYKNNSIKKFTSEGVFHSKIGCRGKRPGLMNLTIHNQELYVCNNGDKNITIFDLNGKFLSCFSSSTSSIFGIGINNEGYIFVSDYNNGTIVIY